MDSLLLPEIIVHILDYLSCEDRKQMALINKTWRDSCLHPKFSKKELFTYDEEVTKLNVDMLRFGVFNNMLCNSKRKVFNLQFIGLGPYQLDNLAFFENIGSHIRYVHLTKLMCLPDSFLNSIAIYCNNIEELSFKKIVKFSLINEKSVKPVLSLKALRFNKVNLTDRELSIFLRWATNLNSLAISNCPVHSNLPNINFSDLMLTTTGIVSSLKTANNIGNLSLPDFHIFVELPKHIVLKTLLLDGLEASTNLKGLVSTFLKHTSIRTLTINGLPCCLLLPVCRLLNLKQLNILFVIKQPMGACNFEECFKQFGEKLGGMKYLRTLTIAPLHYSRMVDAVPLVIPDCTFSSLTSLDCAIENGQKILNFGTKLTSLRIQNGKVLTANDLQLLFKTMTNLRELSIEDCINLVDDVLIQSPISNLKGLVTLKIMGSALTHQCFQYMKLLDLKVLNIGKVTETTLSNLSDFQKCLKNFAPFVPDLRHIELDIRFVINESNYMLHINYCSQLEQLKPCFKRLKYISVRSN